VIIHWFRRDLRITDNTSLAAASKDSDGVLGVYVLSNWKGAHRWTGAMRQEFLCGCLVSLAADLAAVGGRIVIREGDPVAALLALAAETGARAVYFNRDPDPHGRTTEKRLIEQAGRLRVRGFKDVCIHERDEVLTATGGPFRVFSPYARAWAALAKPPVGGKVRGLASGAGKVASLDLPSLSRWGLVRGGTIPGEGEQAARKRFASFLAGGIAHYAERRNIPAGQTTSRISQDLRFGLLSIREVHARCVEKAAGLPPAGRKSIERFVSELIWREFYMAVLWHYPEVLEVEFNPKHRGMRWPGGGAALRSWCEGRTGFPIVDAAMRQLEATGFMHNRARMIAAMFLTKDLHVDWRLGESHFMRKLVDGEIASNNGGWQWSAGTGADAAPYFRIQNPWTQTARFDPGGTYIKTWIPELRDVPAHLLAAPPADGQPLARDYPPPMVDHAEARQITLDLFADRR
jgi:deoxyribodipyrimidine photo-lyase